MKINMEIVNDKPIIMRKFIPKFFVLWATQ
jgi:hypothetical protein